MEITKPVKMDEFREWYLQYSETQDNKNFEEMAELLEEFKKYKEQLKSVNEFGN